MKKVLLFFAFMLTSLFATFEEKININGYFNFEYEERVGGDKSSQADEYGSFDSDMFNMVVNVRPVNRLRIAADLTWEHGPQSEIGKGNVGTEYAFAEYMINDSLKFRGGKMFTAFGIYNELHTAKPTTIVFKEPNPTNKIYFLTADSDEMTMLYPRWGSGIALLGDSYVANMPFDYIFQITNGDLDYGNQDENQYDKDDNEDKGISGRVRVDVTPDLQVGLSFYKDTLNHYKKVYKSKDITLTDGSAGKYVSTDWENIATKDVSTIGGQLIWYPTDKFRLEFEYVKGSVDISTGEKFSRYGFNILPSYLVTDTTNLYLQITGGDPNTNTDQDMVYTYAPGVNVEVDTNMFVKTEIYFVDSQENNSLYGGADYSEFRCGLTVGF